MWQQKQQEWIASLSHCSGGQKAKVYVFSGILFLKSVLEDRVPGLSLSFWLELSLGFPWFTAMQPQPRLLTVMGHHVQIPFYKVLSYVVLRT